MKLKVEMTVLDINNRLLAVPVNSPDCDCVIRVNETAADILELLNADITEEQLIDALAEKYAADRTDILRNVRKFTEGLERENMLIR